MTKTKEENVVRKLTESIEATLIVLNRLAKKVGSSEDYNYYEQVLKEDVEKVTGVQFVKIVQKPLGFISVIGDTKYQTSVFEKGDWYTVESKLHEEG